MKNNKEKMGLAEEIKRARERARECVQHPECDCEIIAEMEVIGKFELEEKKKKLKKKLKKQINKLINNIDMNDQYYRMKSLLKILLMLKD